MVGSFPAFLYMFILIKETTTIPIELQDSLAIFSLFNFFLFFSWKGVYSLNSIASPQILFQMSSA